MSDHLTRIVELTLGLAPTVRPRTVSAPGTFLPDRQMVNAADDGPALRGPEARETAPARGPDGAGVETPLPGPAAPPRADEVRPEPPDNAATPGRVSQAGERPASRGSTVRAETRPPGEQWTPPGPIRRDGDHRPSGPPPAAAPANLGPRQIGKQPQVEAPGEVRRDRKLPVSRPERIPDSPASQPGEETGPISNHPPPARREKEPLTEPAGDGGRAPVEPRALPGTVRVRGRVSPDVPGTGPARSGHAALEDGSPGRGRPSGAASVHAPDGRERRSDLAGTPDGGGLGRPVGPSGRPSVVGAGTSSEAPAAVRITIGRVEARGIPPVAAPARQATRATEATGEKRGPALSLADYLKSRGGRR